MENIIIVNFTKEIINHNMKLILKNRNEYTEDNLKKILDEAICNLTDKAIKSAIRTNMPSDNLFTEEKLKEEIYVIINR